MATKYNSMGTAGGSYTELKTDMNATPIELKSVAMSKNPEFYSSGMGLTFCVNQRSWIDPWEATPSDRFYANQSIHSSRSSSLAGNIASSIEPQKFNKSENKKNESSYTCNGEEVMVTNQDKNSTEKTKLNTKNSDDDDNNNSEKFGPWDGVMAGCLLNIFGVIMFLRVGWIVGQSGVLGAIAILCISTLVTTLTALSMSAICTNGTILAGGAYYIISRTLGPAFGGSVGILLSFGNMCACSMYLIGFAETLVEANDFTITGNDINDVRVWSNIILVVVLILALIGLKYVIKAQIGLLIFISFSILALIIGSFYQTGSDPKLYGIKGWSNGNLADNLLPDYVEGYDFWTTLAIFFPAVTGIMAGANISGELRDSSNDIPQGTLAAIGISSVVYMFMSVLVGAVAGRSSLHDDTLIMASMCIWDYIIYIGIYSATLSSAIASLVGAPRILMAVADDNIISIPGISYFAKSDKNGNPVRGYFLSFGVAFLFNCVGELNLIAPLISQFFIIVYLIINFACFVMEISHSPGWRPSFKYFSRYTALLGALLCLTVMFLLDVWYALATTCIAFGLYLFISWKDPGVSWGGAFDSRKLFNAYKSVINLGLDKNKTDIITMNWRPSFLLILYGTDLDGITYFVETLAKGHSLIFAVEITIGKYRNRLNALNSSFNGYLPIRKHTSSRTHFVGKRVNGFCNQIISESYRNGVQCALQLSGIGVLKPNTLIMSMISNDIAMSNEEYVEILRDGLLSGCGIMICCGFDQINWNMKSTDGGIIDIWWLVDDGGLTLLLPYLMRLHPFFSTHKVRINVVTDDNSDVYYEKSKINELIGKLRLPYTDKPRIILVKNNDISEETKSIFENNSKSKIVNTTRTKVICRWLRLCELLNEYSNDSQMIIVTLPVPTTFITANQYMSILKLMSDQQPPTIIMRGNGQQTLTFHSE